MKRVNQFCGLLVAASMVAVFVASCQKENVTLQARIGHFNSDSKVYMNGFTPIWCSGDNVVVNDQQISMPSSGTTVNLSVPSAAIYKAVYPAEYVTGGMSMSIPIRQIYQTDARGHQLVKAPMGAFCENGSTLQFTPMGSLLAIEISNTTSRGTLFVDSVSVKASSAALWGNATIHDFKSSARYYAIDEPYAEGVNDSVVLSGAATNSYDGYDFAGIMMSIDQGASEVVYVYIPAIAIEESNRFTVRVYAHTDEYYPTHLVYKMAQQNEYSGNIPGGKLASVPFSIAEGNETTHTWMMRFTNSHYQRDVIVSQMNSYLNSRRIALNSLTGSASTEWVVTFSAPITYMSSLPYCIEGATSVVFPEGVKYIGKYYGSSARSITLPSTLSDIGPEAFAGCGYLSTVVSLNPVPPVLHFYTDSDGNIDPEDYGTFGYRINVVDIILHVPSGCADAYRQAPYWGTEIGGLYTNPNRIIDDAENYR